LNDKSENEPNLWQTFNRLHSRFIKFRDRQVSSNRESKATEELSRKHLQIYRYA